MKKKENLQNKIPVFPLSNFIIFPETTVPLNIFEPRYIKMVDDCMKGSRLIGMIQPKTNRTNPNSEIYDLGCQGHTPPKQKNNFPLDLYDIGCVGKITSFNESDDGKYLITLNGLNRFRIINELSNDKIYRECEVSFDDFKNDNDIENNEIKFTDLKIIFKDLKTLFEKKGYNINWQELKKQSLDQTINTLSMASPFSLEEKQVLLESLDLATRKIRLEEILKTYVLDNFSNTTVQ